MPPLEFRFHHVGISVADLDAAIAWWRQMLGFAVLRRYHLPAIPAEIAVLANGALHVELLRVPRPQPAAPDRRVPDNDLQTCGTKHVAFAVDDVRAFTQALGARGVDVVWIKDLPGGRAGSFVRDHEGNLIEFVEAPAGDAAPARA